MLSFCVITPYSYQNTIFLGQRFSKLFDTFTVTHTQTLSLFLLFKPCEGKGFYCLWRISDILCTVQQYCSLKRNNTVIQQFKHNTVLQCRPIKGVLYHHVLADCPIVLHSHSFSLCSFSWWPYPQNTATTVIL